MNLPTSPNGPISEFSYSQGINIDFKRILYQAISRWYFIILSLVLCLSVAYLRNRYATPIYPVTSSIIIREAQETTEGRLLYNNSLVSGFRNYLNELYIIKSYPLIGKTIDELNFDVGFYKEGNFLTAEAYRYLPVKAKILDENGGGREFYFEIVDEGRFRLSKKEVEGEQVFAFNDTIEFDRLKMVVLKEGAFTNIKKGRYLFAYTPIRYLTGSYVSRLRADWAEEGSGVINLSVSGQYPRKDIDFLNGLIKQYQTYDLEKKNLAATRTIEFIVEQLRGITDSLRLAERQLEAFKSKNVITDLGSEARRLYQKVEGLELQKTDLILRESYYKYLSGYIREGEGLEQVILPTSIGITDGLLTALVTEMVNAQTQLRSFPNEKATTFLVEEKKRLINDKRNSILEAIKNQKALDKLKSDFLSEGIREVERQMNKLPLAERQLVSIQRNYSLLESLYVFLLQKKAEAGISRASSTTDIVVVNPPMQIGAAISPKKSQNYLLAVLIGLALPFAAFVILELLNTRVQSREDIEKISSIPFIGGIGHKKADINLEVMNAPKSAIAESFRALRSNLTYFTGNKPRHVFMVASSISGEGKTFTTINLASVFALTGVKVLIVGADLRKPRLYNDFRLNNNQGLSNYLAGQLDFDQIVQKTEFENLDLISGGPVPPNPSELLMSKRMSEFMAIARERYECVIIDTPPLAIVTDAFELAQYADHILFMVRQNHTPKILLKNVEDYYASGKLKNLSIVLNDIYKSGPGYGYGYGYGGYGYGYGGYTYGKGKNGYGYYTES